MFKTKFHTGFANTSFAKALFSGNLHMDAYLSWLEHMRPIFTRIEHAIPEPLHRGKSLACDIEVMKNKGATSMSQMQDEYMAHCTRTEADLKSAGLALTHTILTCRAVAWNSLFDRRFATAHMAYVDIVEVQQAYQQLDLNLTSQDALDEAFAYISRVAHYLGG